MPTRRAFTLVELLVVIAIIGVLVALLLPAIQAAREAARRSECSNHLRQISLAFHQHHGAHGYFPSAGAGWIFHMSYSDSGSPLIAPKQKGGWGFQILPYIEAEATWRGGSATTNLERSIVAISTPHSFMFCPSRRAPEVVEEWDWRLSPNAGRAFGNAKNDYAACCLDTEVEFEDGTILTDPRAIGVITANMNDDDTTVTAIKDVTDGTTHTLLVGEKRMNLHFLGQMQATDNEGYTVGWNHDVIRAAGLAPMPDYTHSINAFDDQFGSSHPGLFNIGMADGSVRTLSFDVRLEVFKRLGHRADGYSIDDDET